MDGLDAELSKRRRELSALRLLAMTTTGTDRVSLCRIVHLAAYAHWEGFSKAAFEAYLGYLCDARKMTGVLKYELRALHFSSMIRVAAAETGPTKAVELIRAIESYDTNPEPFSIRPKEMMRVGNMAASSLKSLLGMVGLRYLDFYATRENFIDEVLCGRRHRIGHGGLEPVDLATLLEVIDGVIELCDKLNDQLQNSLIYDEFVECSE